MNLSVSQRCEFVKNTSDCNQESGFINYPRLAFCRFSPQLLPLAITLYVRPTPTCSGIIFIVASVMRIKDQGVFVYEIVIQWSGNTFQPSGSQHLDGFI